MMKLEETKFKGLISALVLCSLWMFFGWWKQGWENSDKASRFSDVVAAENHLKVKGDCRNCNLKRSELAGLDLSGRDLAGANLQGTDLSSSDLSKANLRGAVLRRADLSSVKSLKMADLTDADLTEANIREQDLQDAILCRTILPNGRLYESCPPEASKKGSKRGEGQQI